MTVSTEINEESYTGNGVTTAFDYRFRILKQTDLTVTRITNTEIETVLTLGTDYIVSGAGSYNGGKVVLNVPLPVGHYLLITRELDIVQETDLRNQGTFFAEVHEDEFDYLTMLIQQVKRFANLALRLPSSRSKAYDAKGNRIANLGAPVNSQDATTKKYVDDTSVADRNYTDIQVSNEAQIRAQADVTLGNRITTETTERKNADDAEAAIRAQEDALIRQNINQNFNRTLRVPEASVNEIMTAMIRGGMLLGFDNNGNPIPIAGQTQTADLAIKLGSEGGSQLIFGLGNIINNTVLIFSSIDTPSAYQSNGFYYQNDGGAAVWKFTGNRVPEKAGTHGITKGMVYNAKGDEYAIDISSGEIKVLANGAKAYTYDQCVDQTTDDFVCLGQASNGILSRLTLGISSANNIATYDGGPRLELICPTNMYRIGKEPIKGVSGVNYRYGASYLQVIAGKSYTYALTGKRLDGWRHGVPEIEEKWNAVGQQAYWGSLSLQNVNIFGGTWNGDHDIRKMPEACSSGVAIMALNPEGYATHGVTIKSTFNWAAVDMPTQLAATVFNQKGHAFDNNTLDYQYITQAIADSGAASRAGNFNRVSHFNSKFEGGRRGTYRNACDWSALYNCEVTNRQAWRNAANISGAVPEYIAPMTGTGLHVSGGYWGPAAAKDYNARNGTVFGTAQNHIFTGVYNEWDYNFYTVAAWGFNGKANRLFSLHLDCVSMYKDNFTEYNNLRFEGGCFPVTDDGGNSVYPEDMFHYDTPSGLSGITFGSPLRDMGAFRHGGYDNKFGPYNWIVYPGTDWDSWRDRPYAKAMFNTNGLALNAGPAMALWENPSIKSEVCIWIYDPTGKFNSKNIYAWITGAGQESSANTDTALYKSFAEPWVDFNNGYKMLKITNKRLTAWDGQYTYARNNGIYFDVPTDGSTPIVIKAIEAYTGGVPVFPNGCGTYVPESPATSVLSAVTNQVGAGSSVGGGIFMPYDRIAPWVHTRRTQTGYRLIPTVTAGRTNDAKTVLSGITLETAMKPDAFTATIATVNSNATTIISIPADVVSKLAVGIPIYVSSGSSTGVTGQIHLIKRLLNSDGTLTNNYLAQGTLGSVGDALTIDQSQIPAYTFDNDHAFTAISATTAIFSGLATGPAFRATNDIGVGYNGATGAKSYGFYYNGGTTPSHLLTASSPSLMTLAAGGNFSVTGNIYGSADNTYSIGLPSNRATQVYAVNSTINTSNKLKKINFRVPVDAENSAFYEIGSTLPFVWQWLDKYQEEGDAARLHSGPTVQDAIEIMTKYGLDWTKYSCFCYMTWDAQDALVESWESEYLTIPGTPAELDEEGKVIVEGVPTVELLVREAGSRVIQAAVEAGEDYAFRKDELLFWITRATIAKQQQMNERLVALENKSS